MLRRLRRGLASGIAVLALAPAVGAQAGASGAPPFANSTTRATEAPAATPPAGGVGAPPDLSPPSLQQFVEAEYPAEARASGTEATVVLSIAVDEQGHVTDVTVAQGAGHGFDEAAVAAARQFQFAPARRAGTAIPARIRYRYRFTLRATSAPQPRGPAAVLRGVLRDAQDRPVPAATLTLHVAGRPDAQATTDATGNFRFELAEPGAATVQADVTGFRPFRAEETLHERDDLQVVYRLSPVPAPTRAGSTQPPGARPRRGDDDEQGVTVRGQRPPREVIRTTLERREIQRIPGTGGDALRAIQNLPGLARPAFLSGALIIRGQSQFDSQIFADGTIIPLLYHFGGLSSVIQNDMLDRIDYYPGNFSARYGRATGGVVDVGIRSPRTRGYHATANINLIDASFFVEGAITPQLSFSVAARRSYVDVVLNAVLSNISGVNLTAAPVYYDYQAVLEWRPNAQNRIRLFLFGDDDTLAVLFRQPNDNAPMFSGSVNLATRFHLAQLLWTQDFAPGTQGRAMLSAGWTGLALNAQDALTFDLSAVPIQFRYEFTHTINRFARLHMGVDVYTGNGLVRIDAPRVDMGGNGSDVNTAQNIATNFSQFFYQPAAYAEAEITPTSTLRIVPGLRVDYDRAIHQAVVSPRMSFRWEFLPGWAIRGGVGLFTQPPQFQQSTSAPNTYFPGQLIGNPNLRQERATHYGLGFEHNFTSNISLTVDGFYKVLDNLVVQAPSLSLLQNPAPPPYNNNGSGLIYGAEVLLRHRANSRFFGWLAYTLLHSERRDGPDLPAYPFNQDQTHILTVLGSYNFGDGWEAGLRFRYVTGSPITPVVGAFYDTTSSTYSPISGARNSARVGDFNQLDVRVDKTFRFRWGTFGIFLEVLNVYNQGNPEGVQYNYNYTQRSSLTGLPIFPNLGVRGEF